MVTPFLRKLMNQFGQVSLGRLGLTFYKPLVLCLEVGRQLFMQEGGGRSLPDPPILRIEISTSCLRVLIEIYKIELPPPVGCSPT